MRRLNRGFFQIALENEEVAGQAEETREQAGEVSGSTDSTTAPTAEVEVTVKVETEGAVEVVKTTEGEEGRAVTTTTAEETTGAGTVETTDRPTTEEVSEGEETREKSETTEEKTSGEETVSTETTVTEGEKVEVKTESGEIVATVETTEKGTVVETDEAKVEVSQDTETGKVEVEVTVQAEEVPAVAAEDMVVIETNGETAEVEICDAVDVAEDTAELTAEIDDAEEAAVALEALAEVTKSAAANGGLDSHGARLLKISTEHIYQHMGLGKAVGIPAMESFEIPGARSSATAIAMEDISEQVKKVWTGIVNGIKQAVAWIQEFIQKIFSANGRIKARAEKLLEASKNISGSPKSKQVGDEKLVRSLSINGKVPTNVAAEVKKTVDFFAGAVEGKTAAGLNAVMDAIKAAALSGDSGKVGNTVKDVIQTISGKGLQHKVSNGLGVKAGISEAPAGTSLSMSPVFLGEQVVWAYTPETVEAITEFRSGIGNYANKVTGTTAAATLTPAQIADIAKASLAYVEAAKGYDEIQDKIKTLNSLVSLTLAGGVGQGNAEEGSASKIKAVLPSLKAARHLIRGIHQPAGVVAARAVQASLDLATASVKQYSAKAA